MPVRVDKEKAAFRRVIREEWSPIVNRGRLTSCEYELIDKWWRDKVPLGCIIRAIHECARRARSNNNPIYSLGYIKPHLEVELTKQARSQVGAYNPKSKDWRERASRHVTDMARDLQSIEPENAGKYRALLRRLPDLTEEEYERISNEIFSNLEIMKKKM